MQNPLGCPRCNKPLNRCICERILRNTYINIQIRAKTKNLWCQWPTISHFLLFFPLRPSPTHRFHHSPLNSPFTTNTCQWIKSGKTKKENKNHAKQKKKKKKIQELPPKKKQKQDSCYPSWKNNQKKN